MGLFLASPPDLVLFDLVFPQNQTPWTHAQACQNRYLIEETLRLEHKGDQVSHGLFVHLLLQPFWHERLAR